jgi:hypothetical protein
MKSFGLIAAAVAGLSCCWSPAFESIARADAPAAASASQDAQIQQWIGDLTSSQYSVRADAQNKLIALGDDAAPLLKAQLQSPASPEQAQDINAIIAAISQNDLLRGPLVSIDADHVPAEQAFKTVLGQANVSYSVWPPELFTQQYGIGPVSLHVHKSLFLPVMWALYQQTGVTLGQPNSNSNMQLTNNSSLDKHNPIVFHGAFAIALQSIQYNRSVNYGNPHPSVDQTFNVSLQLLAVPGLPILQSSGNNVELTAATDDLGQSLLPPFGIVDTEQPQNWNSNQAVSQMGVSANLNRIDGIGTRLKVLKGTVNVRVESDKQQLVIDDLTKPGQTLAIPGDSGIVITFQSFTPPASNNGNCQIKFTIASPSNGNYGFNNNADPQMQQSQMIMGQLQNWSSLTLLDANGQPLSFRGGGGGGGGGQFSYQYDFGQDNNVGPPVKLVFTIYTSTLDTKVPFEFKDVPLP